MADILGTLGIARKAGHVQCGEEPVGAACRAGDAVLVLVASDAADNSRRRAQNFAGIAKRHCLLIPHTKEELGQALGLRPAAMAAVCDAGLSRSIVKILVAQTPTPSSGLLGILEELTTLDERQKARKAEKRAALKNKKRGKQQ